MHTDIMTGRTRCEEKKGKKIRMMNVQRARKKEREREREGGREKKERKREKEKARPGTRHKNVTRIND